MHTTKLALAIGLAALVLSTSIVGAVSTLPPTDTPMTVPTTPIVENGDFGHRFDPADYFTQDFIDRQPLVVKPAPAVSQMDCSFANSKQDGSDYGLAFHNTGNAVIPKGAKFVIVMPDGTPKFFEIPYDIEPGWGLMSGPLFEGAFPENWTCQVAFISA